MVNTTLKWIVTSIYIMYWLMQQRTSILHDIQNRRTERATQRTASASVATCLSYATCLFVCRAESVQLHFSAMEEVKKITGGVGWKYTCWWADKTLPSESIRKIEPSVAYAKCRASFWMSTQVSWGNDNISFFPTRRTGNKYRQVAFRFITAFTLLIRQLGPFIVEHFPESTDHCRGGQEEGSHDGHYGNDPTDASGQCFFPGIWVPAILHKVWGSSRIVTVPLVCRTWAFNYTSMSSVTVLSAVARQLALAGMVPSAPKSGPVLLLVKSDIIPASHKMSAKKFFFRSWSRSNILHGNDCKAIF